MHKPNRLILFHTCRASNQWSTQPGILTAKPVTRERSGAAPPVVISSRVLKCGSRDAELSHRGRRLALGLGCAIASIMALGLHRRSQSPAADEIAIEFPIGKAHLQLRRRRRAGCIGGQASASRKGFRRSKKSPDRGFQASSASTGALGSTPSMSATSTAVDGHLPFIRRIIFSSAIKACVGSASRGRTDRLDPLRFRQRVSRSGCAVWSRTTCDPVHTTRDPSVLSSP